MISRERESSREKETIKQVRAYMTVGTLVLLSHTLKIINEHLALLSLGLSIRPIRMPARHKTQLLALPLAVELHHKESPKAIYLTD